MIAAKIKATQGSEGARRATEIPWGGAPQEVNSHQGVAAVLPDPEVPAKAARRRFTAEYKLRVLTLADACNEPGLPWQAPAPRRALCIKSRHLASASGTAAFLPPCHPRSGAARNQSAIRSMQRTRSSARRIERLTSRLRQAEIIIDVQKKISQILGIPLATPEKGGSE